MSSSQAASLAAPEVSCDILQSDPVGHAILDPAAQRPVSSTAWCLQPIATPFPWPSATPTVGPTAIAAPSRGARDEPPAQLGFVDDEPAATPYASPTPQPTATPTSSTTPVGEPTATPIASPSPTPTDSAAAATSAGARGDAAVTVDDDSQEADGADDATDDATEESEELATKPTVGELAAWVEEQTQRTFTSPATVAFQTSNAVTHEAVENAIGVDDWNLWSTLGLVDTTDSRRVAATVWLEAGKGACCPVRVLVSDDDFETAFVTVHELAHALDWQRAQPQASVQVIPPLLPVVEGNAHRLAMMWAAERGVDPAAIESATAIFSDEQGQAVPTAVQRILSYPYVEGLHFVQAIHDARGEPAVLEAFERPPNGAEVLNPQRWLDQQSWTDVAPPVELLGSAPSTGGQLGAFILSLMIEPHVGQTEAYELVDSWQGDSYVISNTVEQSCVAVRIAVHVEDSAAALGAALRRTGGFVEIAGTTINFTRCT